MNITITIAATPELTEALQAIATALGGTIKKAAPTKVVKDELKDAATPVLAAISSPAAKEEKITVEALRELVTSKVAANKRDQVKSLLQEFGAKNVSVLDASKYNDFHQKLNAL